MTGASDGVVTIQWMDLSSNETGFRIEHQIQAGSTWGGAGTFTVGPARETVTVNVVGGTHRFRVAAYNGGGNSQWTSWSPPVAVSGPADPDPLPSAPANLMVTASELPAAVLRWDDTSSNETGFQIERNPAFSEGLQLVGANVSMYTDQVGLGMYQYRVRAVNSAGSSEFTPWAQIVLTASPPAAPGSPMASDAGNERDINVSWTDNSDNEESFVLQREKQVGSMWAETTQLTAAANATTLLDSPGAGTYRYRIASINSQGQSAYTVWASATAADGWTHFTPSSDTRIVYVSSSAGNDSNDGLSEAAPKRTIAAGYALLRHGYPDWLLLKRGDAWDESLGTWKKSGRSATEKMVVNTYGDAVARPLLRTGTGNGFSRAGGGNSPASIDYLALVGIHFIPHLRTTESPTGIRWLESGRDILFEDCKFEKYLNNMSLQGNAGRIERVVIRRCVIVDAYDVSGSHSQGLFASAIDGLLIEENIFDHNGWSETIQGADPTIFNHNIYIATINTNVVVRNNIIARGSSHGVQLRSGGDLVGNLVVRNAIGLLLGGGTPHPFTHTNGVTGRVIDNVILEGTDISATLPRGFGIDITNIGLEGAQVRNNVIAHKYTPNGAASIQLVGSGTGSGVGCNNVVVAENLVYDWRGPISVTAPPSVPPTPSTFASVTGIEFYSNIVQEPGPGVTGQLIRLYASDPFSSHNNTYCSVSATDRWFAIGSQYMSFPTWIVQAVDRDSTNRTVSFPDPGRSVARYAESLGLGSTLEAVLDAAREQNRLNWRSELSAPAVRGYIRAGFGLPE